MWWQYFLFHYDTSNSIWAILEFGDDCGKKNLFKWNLYVENVIFNRIWQVPGALSFITVNINEMYQDISSLLHQLEQLKRKDQQYNIE